MKMPPQTVLNKWHLHMGCGERLGLSERLRAREHEPASDARAKPLQARVDQRRGAA